MTATLSAELERLVRYDIRGERRPEGGPPSYRETPHPEGLWVYYADAKAELLGLVERVNAAEGGHRLAMEGCDLLRQRAEAAEERAERAERDARRYAWLVMWADSVIDWNAMPERPGQDGLSYDPQRALAQVIDTALAARGEVGSG